MCCVVCVCVCVYECVCVCVYVCVCGVRVCGGGGTCVCARRERVINTSSPAPQ